MGKAKLPRKLIENRLARNSCFKKRKMGIFKKVNEISTLCATEIVVIIQQEEQMFAFGGPDVGFVLNAYQNLPAYFDQDKFQRTAECQENYNSISREFHVDKKRIVKLQRVESILNVNSWQKDIHNLQFDELNKFGETLQEFKTTLDEIALHQTNPSCGHSFMAPQSSPAMHRVQYEEAPTLPAMTGLQHEEAPAMDSVTYSMDYGSTQQLVSAPGVYCPEPSPDMMGSSLHLTTASQQSSVATSDLDTIQFNAGIWPFPPFDDFLSVNSEGEFIFIDSL
ncbi:hypothetical protein KI387_001416 [Taxus chinensis]|uniref:MADS-box domain-containing protein n=1 Tax=Taxus chinensis TaxID=29808 RepID=A0AA38GW47_TAXCH|nr:hypothetical protein KI387_001416 [Taxus chinensis]